uniref:Uncharacterized protein n=1 Tax=Arundo donax TaxID=35708 RepID=A0A0A9G216_ARUDO
MILHALLILQLLRSASNAEGQGSSGRIQPPGQSFVGLMNMKFSSVIQRMAC